MRFEEKTLTINNKKFFYWEKNRDKKTAIIFLHGFPGSHRGIMEMASKMDKYRLVVPDLPACGQSEALAEKHSLKNYADWLNDFLDNLSIDKAIVVGHSFGGRVAVIFSVYYPKRVEKLVLVAPVAKVDSLMVKLASLDYELTENLPPVLQKMWLFNGIYRKAKNMWIFKSSSLKRRKYLIGLEDGEIEDVDARANVEVFDEFYKHKSIAEGQKICIKTLVIACDKDKVASVNSILELCDRFEKPELKIMKNSGHLVVSERPEAVRNIISKWLKVKS